MSVSGSAPGLYALDPQAPELALALLVLGVLADDHHAAFALDDLALLANGFHGRFYLHDVNLLYNTRRLLGTPGSTNGK